jgi:FdhE protein
MRRERPAYRAILEFYEKLCLEKEKHYQSVSPRFVRVDDALVQTKLVQGYPILDKSDVELDLEALEQFFLSLLEISRQRNPDAAHALAGHLKAGGGNIREKIAQMWEGKLSVQDWNKQAMGDPALLFFLLAESLKPVYEYAARVFHSTLIDELWHQRYCPICGSPPSLSESSGEWEGRLLFCLYCGIGWFFSPRVCPFCGTEGERTIKYLHAEHEKHYRIAACTSCQKYLKVIDTQAMGHKVPLDVENIVTLHLDILALKKGYQRGGKFLLLI